MKDCIISGVIFAILLNIALQSFLSAQEILAIPLDSLNEVSPKIELDSECKVEGNNSIKITAVTPCRVTIHKIDGMGRDNFNLKTYLMIKTELEEGTVILETLVKVKGGIYFSRALDQKVCGSSDWKQIYTNFRFKKDESPDEVLVNLIIEGRGIVWADELKFVSENPVLDE
ncbi:MAG: hypothetical protein Kow0029_12180 [Candidatus Rifleibacteriota bacterium]